MKACLREMLKSHSIFRPDPTLPLIFETDTSTKALGASLIQEANISGVLERRLINAASRIVDSAERMYTTITRERVVVMFAIPNLN